MRVPAPKLAGVCGGIGEPEGGFMGDVEAARWPESRIAPDRIARRLYSARHELRILGVRVTSTDEGYVLEDYRA